jgi:hypothetical protein
LAAGHPVIHRASLDVLTLLADARVYFDVLDFVDPHPSLILHQNCGKGLQSHRGGNMVDSSGKTDSTTPQPNEKLVRVFDAEQESEVMVVQGLLQSQGIDTDVTSLDAQQDILPGVGGTIILVREEDAAKARQVIEDYRQAPSEIELDDQADDADGAATEDPSREG